MKTLDIFYQGQGLREIKHIEVGHDHTVAVVRDILIQKHGLEPDTLIYLEDVEIPLEEQLVIVELCGAGANLHLHRCRHVEVVVSFGGETIHHRFAPSATAARIKTWAAITKFGMTEEEAGEHVLQITGTHDRPSPGTHIGTLTSCPACRAQFDLVPDERINGAPAAAMRGSR